MGWRHLLPVTVEIEPAPAYAGPVAGDPVADAVPIDGSDGSTGRSPALAEALARLEVATRLRDTDAAARILQRLADTDEGQWLLRQCVAAGLRDIAGQLADPSVRRIGAA
jgi:hypothetical protein